jgi:hypothetical protein
VIEAPVYETLDRHAANLRRREALAAMFMCAIIAKSPVRDDYGSGPDELDVAMARGALCYVDALDRALREEQS